MYVRFSFLFLIHNIVLTEGTGRLAQLIKKTTRTKACNKFNYEHFASVYEFDPQCDNEVLDENLLKQMNDFKTMEITPVVIEESDVTILITECGNDENCNQARLDVLKKYRVKVQMIQCVNGLIVRHMIDRIRDEQKKGSPYHDLFILLNDYQAKLAKMLSVMYSFRLMVYDWQMIVYINVLAALEYRDLSKQYIEHIAATAVHNIDLHTNFCRSNSYLDPDNKILNPDIINELYENGKLQCGYGAAKMMTVDNFSLTKLHKQCGVILGKSDSYRFKWSQTLKTCKKAMQTIIKLKKKGQWSLQLNATQSAYNIVMTMVYSKVLYHTWLHLSVYRHNLTSQENIPDDRQQVFKVYLNLLLKPLREAIRIFDIVDNAIWPIYRLLSSDDEIVDSEKLDLALYMARGVLEMKLRSMKTNGVSRTLTNKNTSISISDNSNIKTQNIQELECYINTMKNYFIPTDIYFMRFFIISFRNKSFWTGENWTNYK